MGFGYSPSFDVWVKIVLDNTSDHPIKKVIEYTNPLTTTLLLCDGDTHTLLHKGGTSAPSLLKSINPAFLITLPAHKTKTYYLKASSYITTLIVGATLWNLDSFYQKEMLHQFILALFFGAMGIIVFYNLFIYFSTKEPVYLYYFLAFTGIVFHHLLYKGIAQLYLFSPEQSIAIVHHAAFIVAVPTFFLALFTREILHLRQYQKINSLLNAYLLLFFPVIVLCYFFDLNALRNFFSVFLLFFLFISTLYALIKGNRQAKFIIAGWVIIMTSGVFMYLSSENYYNIFEEFPYYVEFLLLVETLLFSLVLADRLKQLRLEKITAQNYLLSYKEDEKERLEKRIAEKTTALKTSLEEKDILLQELNHRVKNSIQTIVSFLRLQIDDTDEEQMQKMLIHVENRIMSISHLYTLLHAKHDISSIDTYAYFTLIAEHIQKGFSHKSIDISIHTNTSLQSDEAIYCGFIINEAITNALQHAFKLGQTGNIVVKLAQDGTNNCLSICDNGCGFDMERDRQSLGLTIIESLATFQLKGTCLIAQNNGTNITVQWER